MEYVCELTDDYPGIGFGDDEYSGTVERREHIVRCRDCKYAFESNETSILECAYFPKWDYYNDEPGHWYVEPDGFCKWGKERES